MPDFRTFLLACATAALLTCAACSPTQPASGSAAASSSSDTASPPSVSALPDDSSVPFAGLPTLPGITIESPEVPFDQSAELPLESSKPEEPTPEEPESEDPKPEEPKSEEPKSEEPKSEEPKSEEPKSEEPKSEDPKPEDPKPEDPKPEEPKSSVAESEKTKAEDPAPQTIQTAQKPANPKPLPPDTSHSTYDFSQSVPERTPVEMNYFSDAAFVGDSRSEGFYIFAVKRGKKLSSSGLSVFTFAKKKAFTLNGKACTALEALSAKEYAKVYLGFGINELGYINTEVFYDAYCNAIDSVRACQPNAVIYAQTIAPVNEKRVAATGGKKHLNNNRVRMFNKLICKAAQEKRIPLLDVYSALVVDGSLPSNASQDGIHLNREYAQKQLAYFLRHTVDFETLYPQPKPAPEPEPPTEEAATPAPPAEGSAAPDRSVEVPPAEEPAAPEAPTVNPPAEEPAAPEAPTVNPPTEDPAAPEAPTVNPPAEDPAAPEAPTVNPPAEENPEPEVPVNENPQPPADTDTSSASDSSAVSSPDSLLPQPTQSSVPPISPPAALEA